MAKSYKDLKERIGVKIYDDDEKFKELDETFKRLKPKSPYKLSEMLSTKFDPRGRIDTVTSIRKDSNDIISRVHLAEQVRHYYMYHDTNTNSVSNLHKNEFRTKLNFNKAHYNEHSSKYTIRNSKNFGITKVAK